VPSESKQKAKPLQADDDIASLSRRISQVTYSDDSTSILDDNDDSEASRDVNSMAEGDMADMEDNDVTTSMIDGEETGNDFSNYLDNNQNVNKGMSLTILRPVKSCIHLYWDERARRLLGRIYFSHFLQS